MTRPGFARREVPVLLLLLASLSACRGENALSYREWNSYLGDKGVTHYSSLDQINRDNVHELEVAWIYRTGDLRDDRSQIQCNPIIVDSVLYGTSPQIKLFALNAATGEAYWTFDPFEGEGLSSALGVNRGVSYWEDENRENGRILFSAGPTLFAIDALTGKPIPTFGDSGRVDLKVGLSRDVTGLFVNANTPGIIYKNLLIQGTRVSEEHPSAPGDIRAYDVRTGELKWSFHTIPHPGEFGYDTWPKDAYQRVGGANAWSGFSLDEERGVVFAPTGSAAFDFWGGNRKGANLFANSILALNAETGKRLWHFQVVKHDIWDRDLPAPPTLVTVNHNGRRIDALAQITKSGHVFVLDRETGESLFPLEEISYPPSDLDGEAAWPTQVLPTQPPPFARQIFTEEMVNNHDPKAHAVIKERFRNVRSGGQFVPPSEEGTMIFPGFDGGGEWGGAAWDPETGLLYVNANEMPWILTMVRIDAQTSQRQFSLGPQVFAANCTGCHGFDRRGSVAFPSLIDIDQKYSKEEVKQIVQHGQGFMPSFGYLSEVEKQAVVDFLFGDEQPQRASAPHIATSDIPYGHTGYNRFVDSTGYPAVEPPWGTLNAIDLNKGEIAWKVPLGEFPELTARGIPQTGTENYGGPIVTAGGLVFIGASKDEKIRAFDKESGKVLWEAELPAGGYATPATYEVGGRQFVVIAAGGGKMGTKSGDAYVAFALPVERSTGIPARETMSNEQ